MIAVDTSTVVDWLKYGPIQRPDLILFADALRREALGLPPPVVAELLSFPLVDRRLDALLSLVGRLPIGESYWERVGRSRATLKARVLKSKLPDALIAQCCIDADVPLITRDADFRHFATHCGLRLAA